MASLAPLPFVKMEACGNHFVVVYAHDLPPQFDATSAQLLCDRSLGVGADGVLVIKLENQAEVLAALTIWNADGSTAETCGNGLRCVALRLLEDCHWTGEQACSLETPGGVVSTRLVPGETTDALEFEVEMPIPRIVGNPDQTFQVKDWEIIGSRIEIGNPHLVVFSRDQEDELPDMGRWARLLQGSFGFESGVNVEWVEETGPGQLQVRVWERGVGETQACGSGACAAAIAARVTGRQTSDPIGVILPGGQVRVSWDGSVTGRPRLCGPARTVFLGRWMEVR